MRVWLLWEVEDYEKDTLHGIYGTEDKAISASERLRRRWRRDCVGYGVGPDEVYETKSDAHEAADRRASEHLRITSEVVK